MTRSRFAFAAYCVLCLFAGYKLGARHDYIGYQWQWRDILAGLDPWIIQGEPTTNTYGPFQNLFALFYGLNPLLPKLLFISGWLAVSFSTLFNYRWSAGQRKWLIAYLLLNPFFLVEFVSWGHHDAALATLIFFAAIQMNAKKEISAGILLACGILLKFVPVFLIPFFWIDHGRSKRWHHRFLLSCVGTMIAGFAISYLKWGSNSFYPLVHASNRPPTMLSVFHFLQGPFSPVKQISPITISLSSKFLMIVGSLFVFERYLRVGISRTRAIAAELLTVFLFYQVGHQQFHSSILFLLPLVVQEAGQSAAREDLGALLKSLGAYAGFLMIFELAFVSMGQYSAGTERMNEWIAIPYLLIGGSAVYRLLVPKVTPVTQTLF